MPTSVKLIYLVTEDWYFCSHRLPLAKAACRAGYEVVVVTRVRDHDALLRAEGFRVVPIGLRRKSLSPWREIASIWELIGVYRHERPAIVHQVALKPVIYGSIAASIARIPHRVNALAGLGFVFSSNTRAARALNPIIRRALAVALRRGVIIVQNRDDRATVIRLGTDADRVVVIGGSGVDLLRFTPTPFSSPPVVITLVARMLWDKGVGELVEAARQLKQEGWEFRVQLVGQPDQENPASITERCLRAWSEEGSVEWLGHRDDIAKVWADSHVAVLPSYREGMPKSLLEAGACARPLVTTDVPGCRELVTDEVNGLLVPPRDSVALAHALRRLIRDPMLRQRLGCEARRTVEAVHGEADIARRTIALYQSMTGEY